MHTHTITLTRTQCISSVSLLPVCLKSYKLESKESWKLTKSHPFLNVHVVRGSMRLIYLFIPVILMHLMEMLCKEIDDFSEANVLLITERYLQTHMQPLELCNFYTFSANGTPHRGMGWGTDQHLPVGKFLCNGLKPLQALLLLFCPLFKLACYNFGQNIALDCVVSWRCVTD